MKKLMSVLLCLAMILSLLAGCSKTPPDSGKPDGNTTGADGAGNDAPDTSGERKTVTMWFWGASDYQREAMDQYLIEGFNSSQDQYTLSVEYRASVDNDIAVALSGGAGPDIVYGSGPAFVAGYAAEGLFLNLDSYSQQYGWKDRLVDAYYDLCSIDGSLYSIPGGMSNYGIFYNIRVLEENNWSVPASYEDLISIMDQASAAGMYGGLIGAKDWRYTNEWPVSMLLTSVAGPEAVYKCLTGEQKWNSPQIVEAAAGVHAGEVRDGDAPVARPLRGHAGGKISGEHVIQHGGRAVGMFAPGVDGEGASGTEKRLRRSIWTPWTPPMHRTRPPAPSLQSPSRRSDPSPRGGGGLFFRAIRK